MKETGVAGLIKRFADLPDHQVQGRTDHDLPNIVVLAHCAVVSSAEGRDDMDPRRIKVMPNPTKQNQTTD